MPIASFQHSLASPGYAPDMAHGQLPPQVWTDGANMRFVQGAPTPVEGSEAAHTVTTSVIHAINVYTATSNFWVYATTAALFATDGASPTDITRVSSTTTVVPYGGSANLNWTSAPFGNFLVMNDGVDVPQSWSLSMANRATDLANWPSGWVAQSVRSYRNYLVAMDITIGVNRYPSLVAWSDSSPYDAATLPEWTPTTTNDAGDNNLNDTPGWCVDGMAMGGSFIIYKEDAVWAMTYVAGAAVMGFRKLFEGVGLLSRRCVQEFNGKHFFVGRGDVFVHDGVNIQSVAANRVRETLFSSITSTTFSRTFTAIDRARREIWVCYADNADYPNYALVWNYETDTWYPPRTLAQTAHIVGGIVDTSVAGTTYDASAGVTYDADTGPFDIRTYNPSEMDMLACRPAGNTLDRMNRGTVEDGVAITAYLSRKLLPFDGQDTSGGAQVWTPQMKLVRRVWLDATGTGYVSIYIGVQDTESATPTWRGPYRVDLASQNYVWTFVRGRFISVKFAGDSATGDWILTGYKLEWEPVGGF